MECFAKVLRPWRLLLFLILLIPLRSFAAQNNLFYLSVIGIDETGFEDSDIKMKQMSFDAKGKLPIKRLESGVLLFAPSFSMIWLDFTNTESAGISDKDFPDTLFSGELALIYNHRYTDGWSATIRLAPGIKSDLEDIGEKDISKRAMGMVNKKFSNRASIGLGLAYADSFGSPQFFPLLKFNWVPFDTWIVSGVLPVNLTVEKQFSDNVKSGLSVEMVGGQYRMTEEAPWNDAVLNYRKALIGPFVALKVSQKTWLEVSAGITASQKFEFKDKDDTDRIIAERTPKNAAFIKAAYYFPF